jgi:hypothetical protein
MSIRDNTPRECASSVLIAEKLMFGTMLLPRVRDRLLYVSSTAVWGSKRLAYIYRLSHEILTAARRPLTELLITHFPRYEE